MSSKARSIRRAATRAQSPAVQRKGMTLPQILDDLSRRIDAQAALIREMEVALQEHEEKIAAIEARDAKPRHSTMAEMIGATAESLTKPDTDEKETAP